MSHLGLSSRSRILMVLAVVAGGLAFTDVTASLTVLGVQYQQDNPYPEYQCLWHDGNYPASCGTEVVGANVHVYLRNDGASPVRVDDVTLAGFSLKKILRGKQVGDHPLLRSIYFYWDNPPQAILDAGEPVWYRADPATIPPGGVAQVVVRLRFVPVTRPVSLGIVTSAGTVPASIPVSPESPQLASVGFSPDLTQVYLHWRRAGGAAPATILMDGIDVTAGATSVGDPALEFGASVLRLAEPLAPMSYHLFQGVFADGSTASASLRAWVNPFLYGTWGAMPTNDGDLAAARAWIDDATNRGINALVMNISSGGLADLLARDDGRRYAEDHGYGFVFDAPDTWSVPNPRMWFIDDEPDAEEAHLSCGQRFNLPCGEAHHVGVLAMSLLERGEELRRSYPLAPTTINMNGSYKPANYYSYGQLADVLMVDSYYQRRLADTYWDYPQRVPLYERATVIYATSLALTTAAEPNPTHFLLYSNQQNRAKTKDTWPFPTPESKRIEVYYALAGGAKGMAYWWLREPSGLGAGGAGSQALWREIGLLGNEIKTAAPLLVTSHPVALDARGSDGVWVRSLAASVDTLLLLVVNDQYRNDRDGIHVTPVNDATVTATLPAWMQSPSAFEITAGGLHDVGTAIAGNQVRLDLGRLDLTRMIVLTTNPQLRATIQQRYDQQVAPGVCAFVPEYCTEPTPVPTAIPTSVPTAIPTAVPTAIPTPTPWSTPLPTPEPTGLENGNFDAGTSGWTVAPSWTSYNSGAAAFEKDTTTYRSSPNAQRVQPPTSGASEYAGILQTVDAGVGDAVTFVAWAYQDSAARYETARLGARFDGVTSPPSNWVNVTARQMWTELRASGTVTAAGGATVFLDVVRSASGGYWSSFDDVSALHAYLPPAPLVSGSNATSLRVDVQPGSNSTAEFAITVGGGAFTAGTSWVQADGTIGTAEAWQTDAAWADKAVTGLVSGTTYTFRVKARYSSAYTRETDLGAGAQGAPTEPNVTPTELVPTPTLPVVTATPPVPTPTPGTGELRRYWVKPDWLSPYWGYQPRPSAPAPAVNRSGEIGNHTYFRRAWLTEEWQWFWADLLALSKYQRVYAELTSDEQAFITRAFGGLTGDHLAFTNNAGSGTRNCYPCGETDRGEDMKIDPLICGGNTVLGSDPVQNERGEWMVKVYSFDANQPPPPATLAMLDDPRVLWATIISTNRLPDGSFHLFGFPQLKDGTRVPYPYLTVEEYYYPLEELEEYPLTDPKRPIYNP